MWHFGKTFRFFARNVDSHSAPVRIGAQHSELLLVSQDSGAALGRQRTHASKHGTDSHNAHPCRRWRHGRRTTHCRRAKASMSSMTPCRWSRWARARGAPRRTASACALYDPPMLAPGRPRAPVQARTLALSPSNSLATTRAHARQIAREILEERKSKELRKIESAITLDINFERKVQPRRHPRPFPCSCPVRAREGIVVAL